MSFLDVFGIPDEEPEPQHTWTSPPWFGPPDDELPACVGLSLVIGRSAHAVVALSHVQAHSTGLGLEFVAQAHGLDQRDAHRMFHEQHAPPGTEPSEALLRIGLELPGGERVSNLGGRRPRHDTEKPPDGAVLMQHGGGGGSGGSGTVSMRPGFWLWPLVGAGTLRVSCEWPIVGIPLSSVELDTAPLRAASARVQKLWS